MIAAKNYEQDFLLHLQLDRWDSGNRAPVKSQDLKVQDKEWGSLPNELQQNYIDWIFFLVQTGRI